MTLLKKKYISAIIVLILILNLVSTITIVHSEDNTITIEPGKTYEFINNDAKEKIIEILNNIESNMFEYIIYGSDGLIEKQGINGLDSDFRIPVGGNLVISVPIDSQPVILGGVSLLVSVYISLNPALHKVTLDPGDSYEFINKDTKEREMITDTYLNKFFDYAIYNKNGIPVEQGINSIFTTPVIPAGGKVVITIPNGSKPVKFGGSYKHFTGQRIGEPALHRVTLKTGENYEFINNDTEERELAAHFIGNIKYFDYAVYNSDGTSKEQGINSWFSCPNVPAGGKVIITIPQGSNDVVVGGYNEVYTGKLIDNPALHKVTLNPGESYEFKNNDTEEQQIVANGLSSPHLNDRIFDYIIYRNDGTVYDKGLNAWFDNPIVPSGGRMIVTIPSSSKPVTFGGYYNFFTGRESDSPALLRVILNPGESYEFFNNDKNKHEILANGISSPHLDDRIFDFIVYRSDGTVYEKELNAWFHDPDVPPGGRMIVTIPSSSKPVTFGGSNEFFTGKVSNNPAFHRVILNPGESYEFINNNNKVQNIMANGISAPLIRDRLFDYAIYKSDGTSYDEKLDAWFNDPDVPPGGKLVVSVPFYSDPVSFGGIYEYFNGQRTEEPALHRVIVRPGESYEFINNDNAKHTVLDDGSSSRYYDVALYNSDGTSAGQGFNLTNLDPEVPAGGSMIVTVPLDSKAVLFGGYNKFFTSKVSESVALHKVTLNPGESYVFINNDTEKHTVLSNEGSGKYYNYASYNSDGTSYDEGLYEGYRNAEVPAGGRLVVTVQSYSDPVTFGTYSVFSTGYVSEQPALHTVILNPGESYEFTNNDIVEHKVLDATSSTRYYDLAIYKSDGTEAGQGLNLKYQESIVPPGGRMIVTVPQDSKAVLLGGSNEFFTGQVIEDPALHRITLNPGESYKFINKDIAVHTVLTEHWVGHYDYAIYNSDGTAYGEGLHENNKDVEVPAGGSLVVTVPQDSDSITFGGYNEHFTGNVSEKSALHKVTIEPGETYEFLNNGNEELSILNYTNSDNNEFDYILYNSDSSSYEHGLSRTWFNTKVSPGGKIVITVPLTSGAITFGGCSEFFTSKVSEDAALNNITIEPGDSYEVLNSSEVEQLASIYGNFISYYFEIYNSNNELIDNGNSVSRFIDKITIPKSGRLVLSIKKDETNNAIVTYGKYITVNKVVNKFVNINGNIKSTTIEDISKITVEIFDNNNNLIQTINCDKNGSYSFKVLTPGVYYIKPQQIKYYKINYDSTKFKNINVNEEDIVLQDIVYSFGDFNEDNEINEDDLNKLKEHYSALNNDSNYIEEFDLNKDGKINLLDIVVYVKKYLY